MTKTTHMTGSHQNTYKAIFQHPAARNLHWRDVRSLLAVLADVTEEANGNLKATRGGQTLILHPSRDKVVGEIDELMEIRHFLERSSSVATEDTTEGAHLLVVIDHREARIYKTELHGSVPQRITPYDPEDAGRHLHYVEDDANGQRRPERKSFYEAVAKTLQRAEQILIFGGGTGASSAMEHLLAELKHRHPQVAGRVIGSIVVDEQHLSDDQLLAKARDCYAKAAAEGALRIPPAI